MTTASRFHIATIGIILGTASTLMAADGPAPVLEAKSMWRSFFVWGQEVVAWESGEVAPFKTEKDKGMVKVDAPVELTVPPSDAWAATDFDDAAWALAPGPFVHASYRRDLAGIYLRGRLDVADPAAAGEMTLNLRYRGGAAVYLNGKEIARQDLPEGKLSHATTAKVYPKEAFVGENGELLKTASDSRKRSISCKIAANDLKKGVNVLAVEIHRAPTSQIFYTATRPKIGRGEEVDWSMLGFDGLELSATSADAVNRDVAAGKLRVWVGNPMIDVWEVNPGEPTEKPAALSIPAARNGAFTGTISLRQVGAIKGLEVKPADLKSPDGGTIAAQACQVRYAAPGVPGPETSTGRYPKGTRNLGVLLEAAPAEIPLPANGTAVTTAVWLTWRVPADAKPGKYTGTVSVKTAGAGPVDVPIELTVADYAFADTKDFTAYSNLIESPDSVALQYGKEMWSEDHWKLLDKVFALMGQVAVHEVFVPLIAQANEGNEFSMVRWIKKDDGSWDHDYTLAEKYLDLTVKHLGKKPLICLYIWTPVMGGGGFGAMVDKAKNDVPMKFTVLDPKTGKMTTENGPDWGAPESVPFWKPVFEGMKKRLADRGLDKNVGLGLLCDRNPTKQCIADMNAIAPEMGWNLHAHGQGNSFAGKPLVADTCVWGVKGPFVSNESYEMFRSKRFGWKNKIPTTVFPRYGAGNMGHVRHVSPLGVFHAVTESYLAGNYNGLGRSGADFWPVIKDAKGNKSDVISRFPSWQRPGAPSLTIATFLYPAESGPVASVPYEILRMGVQESEARVSVEMVLEDKAKRAKLPPELVKKAQDLLDERIKAIIYAKTDKSAMYSIATDASWTGYAQGYADRARKLYDLAAEVTKAAAAK